MAAFEIAQRITRIRNPVSIPTLMLKITAAFSSVIEKIILLPEMYSSEALRVQSGVTYLSANTKARNDLGYNPSPLEIGLMQTLEYELSKLKK